MHIPASAVTYCNYSRSDVYLWNVVHHNSPMGGGIPGGIPGGGPPIPGGGPPIPGGGPTIPGGGPPIGGPPGGRTGGRL